MSVALQILGLRRLALTVALWGALGTGAGAAATQSPAWVRDAIDRGLEQGSANEVCDARALKAENGVAVSSDILRHMEGFAKVANTTGGLGRPVYTVTSVEDHRLRDQSGPPGSLREALWKARQSGGGWIVFSDQLPQRQIALESGLQLPRNTTIDGGCKGFTLTVDRGGTDLTMKEDNNIVVRMRLEQRAPFVHGHGDCINGNGADRLWIAFNALRRCENILVDIGTRNYSPTKAIRSTVAYNILQDHEKDMLFATYDCEADHVGCENQLRVPWTWQGGVQTTVQGNVFDSTSQRHPRLAGQSYAHLIDNVIAFAPFERAAGEFGPAYGSYAGDGSRMLVTNNLYIAPDHSGLKAVRAEQGKGATRLIGNVLLGGPSVDETGGDLVSDPPYELRPSMYWQNAAAAVTCAAARVGPSAAQRPPTPCR